MRALPVVAAVLLMGCTTSTVKHERVKCRDSASPLPPYPVPTADISGYARAQASWAAAAVKAYRDNRTIINCLKHSE